jgi:hypothetical protein
VSKLAPHVSLSPMKLMDPFLEFFSGWVLFSFLFTVAFPPPRPLLQ